MAGMSPDMARSPSVASPRLPRSRTHSISSDRPSTIGGHGLVSPPVSVSPEAAFIAASAASQIVTNDHDSHADSWYDESGMLPAGETALVSFPALQLVNSFLDQLLFNFLQVSKATTLSALRPAVTEVLKPKLAKDAINNADEELREYLGGGDEDDYVQPHGADPGRDWDLELVWKRTRLRCMVYSSLGDMEEEDEDLYMEQENLEIGADEQISDVISPAVAIFLTSVLEYMGELTLTVAGQASYHRLRTAYEKELKEGTRSTSDIADRIVVEEGDMERVALDRTLGRLWRGWKKRIRAPAAMDIGGRPFSRNSFGHHRNGSNLTDVLTSKPAASDAGDELRPTADVAEEASTDEAREATAEEVAKEPLEPAEVPLPMGEEEDDVDEIEIPGLAYNSDDEDEEEEELPQRPKSFVWPNLLVAQAPAEAPQQRPRRLKRERSASLPHSRSRFISASDAAKDEREVVSPMSDEDKFEEAVTDQPGAEVATPDEVKTKASATMSGPLEDDAYAIGIARTTDDKGADSGSEYADDDVTYERAEVMTSSRVSVASNSPSNSEEDAKKSNNVPSNRVSVVDVKHGSQSPSIDATERSHGRSASLSRVGHSPSPSNAEDSRKPRGFENAARPGAAISPLRSSLDRVRNSETISESDEESDSKAEHKLPHQEPSYTTAAPVTAENTLPKGRQAVAAPPRRTSSRHQQVPSNTKVTILNHSSSSGPFIDEVIPEVPVKASNRASGAPDAGSTQLGRQRTRTTDSEDAMLPIQTNTSQRQTHTSGSSSSSATGRHKAIRTSEEHVPSHAESVARNFEQLIQSNQTITYTLTPENMRDMDSPRSVDSPVMPRFPTGDRSRSSSTATEVKGAPSSRMVAVSSHSPTERNNKPSPITVPSSQAISLSKSAGLKSPTKPASPETTPRSSKVPASLARDARVPTDSTADFAEFIKSTGPPGDKVPPPHRNGAAHTSTPSKTSLENRRVSSTSNRNRYQPRDAAVDENGDNSDLIDFLRQGPASSNPNPRIPRHVAPFRNTMDSEHMSSAAGGRAVDATIPEVRNSQASTSVTEPSIQSSANSNTALLRNKAQPAPHRSNMFDEDDMMPKRKQRRVRDPYAIDFSDEEEDEAFMVTPKPPVKKEESLAEFLKNYDPPPEPVAQPVSQKIPKKKASAPSLMGRFNRAAFGRENFSRDKEVKGTPAPTNPKPVPESRSLSSRVGTANSASSRGHIPIQVNMPSGYDKYGSLTSSASQPRSTPGGGVLSGGPVSSGRKVPMKKFEPREPTPATSRTGTADLAAFLRDSEPPPSLAAPSRMQSTGTGGEGRENVSLSKMFGRRKKPVL